MAGPGAKLAPTKALRYIYAVADPLNQVRESGVYPLGAVDDLAGRVNANENIGRLGYIDRATLQRAMDHGTVNRKLTDALAQPFVAPLNAAMSEFFIFTVPQQAAFLAQISHESSWGDSDGLVQLEEFYVLNKAQKINSRPQYTATSAQDYFDYWYGPNTNHPSPATTLGNTQRVTATASTVAAPSN